MRIGELSKQSGVPISTIRYYIQTGLLVPDSGNSQYVFDERDTQSLQRITQLKSWGLSLDNVHSILSMNRISGGVEKESYEECIELLRKHQKELQSKCDLYQRYIKEIDEVIVPLQTKADALKNEKKIPHNTGVPVQALRLLCCPHCGNSLQISNADIDSNFLYNGELHCTCGYTAKVENGIVYASHKNNYSFDQPDVERSIYRTAPNELVSLIQKSYNGMETWIQSETQGSGKIIMETHLNSFFYLYRYFKQLRTDHIYIVQDKFSAIIELYKKYVDQMEESPQVLYLVAADDEPFPLKKNEIDLLVDYNSTNEYGIYHDDFYLDKMYPYLKPSGKVVGTYFYFDPRSRSLSKLTEDYPQNNPKNYTMQYFQNGISRYFRDLFEVEVGYSTDSGQGRTFCFHQKGEKLHLMNYMLEVVGDAAEKLD